MTTKTMLFRDSPGGPVVPGFRASTAGGPGSIPGQGTKIPHAAQRDQKKRRKKKKTMLFKLLHNRPIFSEAHVQPF